MNKEDITKRLKEIDRARNDLKFEASGLLAIYSRELAKYKVGDIVEHPDYGLCRVSEIHAYFGVETGIRVEYKVNEQKKDGGWSSREKRLYSWDTDNLIKIEK